jgi:2-amino-4-hydroxy-6-hydroxymethyldihydropteridine diphosphokinase
MTTCYIALGSNLGDRRFYIESAVKKIRSFLETRVRKVSSIIQTAACGGPVQGPFLNAVAEIETNLSPYQLLLELQKIESAFGRVRQVVNGPRTLDLDILIYGDICINEAALCIPHPRMLERDFVMLPLSEIAPELAKKLQKKSAGRKSVRLKPRKKQTTAVIKRNLPARKRKTQKQK